ncbi:uncharacterized protein LOC123698834 isoform X1 [Colias croceus]|uniref:uncharacterized protein LOC123698834 isoform X1 n=1 Tax=Colias crocea TaxID=72248 RepID=UPI001E27DE35|nr:uncharacterized protein LOC123698834 isoform X1 [Colias croceus]
MPPVLRSNPLYTEEEEQEVVIIVDSLEPEDVVEVGEEPCTPRRAPSTSSGSQCYGSGAGSHGRVSPNLPKNEQYDPEPIRLSEDKNGSQSPSDSDGTPPCTLSRSLKEDIRSCLGGCRWEKDVNQVVEAAVRGAGGMSAARARLHAALLALHEPSVPNRGPSLPYCGPGVRPGDVTMMPKSTGMSLLAASALFTLDGARGEELSRRLARGQKRRRRCRAILALLALLLLLVAVGAVELLMSRGQRVFGAVLR